MNDTEAMRQQTSGLTTKYGFYHGKKRFDNEIRWSAVDGDVRLVLVRSTQLSVDVIGLGLYTRVEALDFVRTLLGESSAQELSKGLMGLE